MSTREYIIKTAKETEDAVWTGLSVYLYRSFLKAEKDEFASDLSLACVAIIRNKHPAKPESQAFSEQNARRIQREVRGLDANSAIDRNLREILSGAAYNIGYGIYVASGGGLLLNRYVRFIRVESETDWHSAPSIRRLAEAQKPLPYGAVELIMNLKNFGLWIARSSNPNEQEYYRAVQSFHAQQMLWLKQNSENPENKATV